MQEEPEHRVEDFEDFLVIEGVQTYNTLEDNDGLLEVTATNGFLCVRNNRGTINIEGNGMLVVVYENEGIVRLAGKNNDLRIMIAGTGSVDTADGAANRLNGLLL